MRQTRVVFLPIVFLAAFTALAPVAVAGCALEGCGQRYRTAEAAQSAYSFERKQQNNNLIPPSTALKIATDHVPGSQGLGVRLLTGQRLVYAVKLRKGDQVRRILVDARSGRIVGE